MIQIFYLHQKFKVKIKISFLWLLKNNKSKITFRRIFGKNKRSSRFSHDRAFLLCRWRHSRNTLSRRLAWASSPFTALNNFYFLKIKLFLLRYGAIWLPELVALGVRGKSGRGSALCWTAPYSVPAKSLRAPNVLSRFSSFALKEKALFALFLLWQCLWYRAGEPAASLPACIAIALIVSRFVRAITITV